MSDSINRIVTIIASHLDKEQDEPFKRLLAPKVDQWRSTLVSRSLEKHPAQRRHFMQTIWVPMECKNLIPCPTPMSLQATAKSKFPIPDPMRADIPFDYVGSINGLNPFRQADAGTMKYLMANKYAQENIYFEWENKDIRIRSNNHLPMIRIDGVFDRPTEVAAFNCKLNNQCDFWDTPYPATGDIIQMIIQYILQIDYAVKAPNTPTVPEVEVNPQVPRAVQP